LSGWKSWEIGEVVEASDFQSFVQDQTVQKYADAAARGSALGTAVAEGMVSYLDDSNQVEVYDGSAWVSVGQDLTTGTQGFTALSNGTAGLTYQPVSHNYIINGAFDVWQRGTAVTHSIDPALTGSYTADRFKFAGVEEGVAWRSVTLSRSTNSTIGLPFSAKATLNNAAISRVELRQEVENGTELNGKSVTLSFYIRRIATVNANTSFFVYHGSTQISVGNFNDLSTSDFTRVTRTFTSSSTQTFGVRLTRAGGAPLLNATGDLFEITGVQLEAGSVATPFKRHAPDVNLEKAACEAYYVRTDSNTAGAFYSVALANGTTNAFCLFNLPTTMRAKPTAIDFSGLLLTLPGAADYSISAVTLQSIRTTQKVAGFTVTTTGLTDLRPYYLAASGTASFIGFSAEL
jgi:hypothetical protein